MNISFLIIKQTTEKKREAVCQETESHVAPPFAGSEQQRHLQDLDPVQEIDQHVRTVV